MSLNTLSFIYNTWTTNCTGLHTYETSSDLFSDDDFDQLTEILNNKFVIGIYDPMLELITNGKIVGQQVLNNGLPTGEFSTVTHLRIPRGNGNCRQLSLIPCYINDKLLGYSLDVESNCAIGYYNIYLSPMEQKFYKQFVFTWIEPIPYNLFDVLIEK